MSIRSWRGGFVLLLISVLASAAFAGDFAGTYVVEGLYGPVTLTLTERESGAVRGSMIGGGVSIQLDGRIEGSAVKGAGIDEFGQPFGFAARLQPDGGLHFSFFPIDEMGNAYPDAAQSFVMARQGSSSGSGGRVQAAGTERDVRINRVELSDEHVRQLEMQYQAQVPNGSYWYDAMCGAWGMEGGPTLGFIPAGMQLPGPMPADVSGGGTGIFINGREVHVQDQAALQQIFGMTIPGRYWLDAQGNLGIEGGGIIANLRIAAGQAYGSATGAGGTAAQDGEGGSMFFAPKLGGKSVFWYSGM
jgi:hypothetical protein